MTTAHRPTWHNALGGEGQGGTRLAQATTKRSARDQPGELKLKTRAADQLPKGKDRKALAEELKKKEATHKANQKKTLLTLTALPAIDLVVFHAEMENPFPEDADDVEAPVAAAKKTEEGNSSSEESDDEEEELLRELEKIKKERAEKEAAAERALEEQRRAEQQERMLRANPLLLNSKDGEEGEGGEVTALKRRWDDEAVFKNQSKNLPAPKKHFINDPVRSEFHKKFLNRYID
ncbi:hypothetical protein Efla_004752 [Eimeria flavescens]